MELQYFVAIIFNKAMNTGDRRQEWGDRIIQIQVIIYYLINQSPCICIHYCHFAYCLLALYSCLLSPCISVLSPSLGGIQGGPYIFLESSINLANPISVNGCFSKPKIESKGQVQTSAPASAQRMIWFGLRIDAAKICVSKPWIL